MIKRAMVAVAAIGCAAIAVFAAVDAVAAAAIEPPFLFWQREILEPEQRSMAAVGVTQYAMLNSTRHYEHPYWTGPGELSTEALFAARKTGEIALDLRRFETAVLLVRE